MTTRALVNQLVLAFAPICNYDFALLKDDEGFQHHVRDSMLYIIAQRSELTFEQLRPSFEDDGQTILAFEIRQKGHPEVLTWALPLYQEAIAQDIAKEISFHFMYALPLPNPMTKTFPQNGIRNLLMYYHDGTFISWLSPESLLQNFLNGHIYASVEGPIEKFLSYHVHYVGKATEQEVWKRLTGHSTLQEILSVQYPFQYGTLPTHEIAVLFLKVQDSIGMLTIGPTDEIPSDIAYMISGANQPSQRTISLDAEKALIQAMKPGYNKVFYDNYPTAKDGLSSFDLDSYSYQIYSRITLTYKEGEMLGRPDPFADALLVQKGKPLQVIHRSDALASFQSHIRKRLEDM